MAIAFRASVSNESTANSTDVTVTIPATVASGDTMVMVYSTAGTDATLVTPTGWTVVDGPIDKTTNVREYLLVKTATGADASSSLTVSKSVASATKKYVAISVYSGCDGSSPVQNFASLVETTAGTTHAMPTTTATGTGCWLLGHCTDRGSPASTNITPPAGFTERLEQVGTGSGTLTVEMADSGAAVTAGTVGGGTYTGTVSTANAITWAVVLQPPSGTNATATPGRVNATSTLPTPSVAGLTTIVPARVSAIATVGLMAGQAGSIVNPDLTPAISSVLTPTVSIITNPIVDTEVIGAIASVFTPTVTSLAGAEPGPVLAEARVMTPTVVVVEPIAFFVTNFGSTFTPPSRDFPRSMARMTMIPVGSTVLRVNGSWVVTVYPSETLVNSADRVYRGGRRYPISQSEAADLIAAGFGAHIESDFPTPPDGPEDIFLDLFTDVF
jgi:hypothetical protein